MSQTKAEVLAMNPGQRTMYFEHYAAYFSVPCEFYAIRIGSVTLKANDTRRLRGKFDDYLKREAKSSLTCL